MLRWKVEGKGAEQANALRITWQRQHHSTWTTLKNKETIKTTDEMGQNMEGLDKPSWAEKLE